MSAIIQLSRIAYSLCIIAMGIQQLAYGEISGNFLPGVEAPGQGYHLFAYAWGILFTLSGIAMLINWKARQVALISGGVFLLLLVGVYCPYYLWFSPDGHSLLGWSAAIEESAFVGSSFIMAQSYSADGDHPGLIRGLGRLARYGRIFFGIMLVCYGMDHFLVTQFVSEMIPGWIPAHIFWTYFAGVALIGTGVSFILNIQVRLVASLFGVMIFLWFLLLHIPTAIDYPTRNGGLELSRVFVSFGFTGIAFLLAFSDRKAHRVAAA